MSRVPSITSLGSFQPSLRNRRMEKATLAGKGTYATGRGVDVGIWVRDGKYIARGRWAGKAFGTTLGADADEAERRLRRMLVEIDDGTFVRQSDRPRRQLKPSVPARLPMRTLCDEFLTEKRKLCGKNTAQDYQSRLRRLIEFAETPAVRKTWPVAADIDRTFALDFRSFLYQRCVTPNGRASGEPRPMAPRQTHNILDCVRTMVEWAKNPAVSLLPSWLANPFTEDIVGQRPRKDPLRPAAYPLEERIEMVRHMDRWQLAHLVWRLVLPLRPEDFAGLLISDVDVEESAFRFETRYGGGDFNKGAQQFRCPFPAELRGLLDHVVGGRSAGPLLRGRQVYEGRRAPRLSVDSPDDVTRHIERALGGAAAGDLQAPQDHKRVIRDVLRQMGGLSGDGMAREIKKTLAQAGIASDKNTYQLRAAVNTEMEAAGVSLLVQEYVTGHKTNHIQYHYVTLDPHQEMRKYFSTLGRLFDAIRARASEVGIDL